jgi:hypothetical protein
MKYLKIYEDFNNKEKELETMFSLVMGNTEVYKISYSYYGTATKERRDFDIYVVSGVRNESNDHKLVQELYHNHKILNEVFNLEFFHIGLSKKYATVVLYDYVSSFDKNNKNHLSSIYTSKLPLPSNVKSRLKFTETSSRLSVRRDGDYLNRGIDFSDGSSSNIALHDWIYVKPERYTNDDVIQSNSISESTEFDQSKTDIISNLIEICRELEDINFKVDVFYFGRNNIDYIIDISQDGRPSWWSNNSDIRNDEQFLFGSVEEHFMNYMKELGYKIKFNHNLPAKTPHHITYNFIKESLNESNVFDKSVVDECKDILLELEDKGFKTNISSYFSSDVTAHPMGYRNVRIEDMQRIKIYKYYKNCISFFFNREKEFDYSDIEDVVERLKSYLSEFGLSIEWIGPTEIRKQKPTIKTTRVMNPTTFEPYVRTTCELHFN